MSSALTILALDTALGPCSVAVTQGGALLAEEEETTPGQQSKRLVLMMESALARAGLAYQDCDAIACTRGPGGFTGIRTALAAARAIVLATCKPLITLTTLETLAFGFEGPGDVLACIDAYRGEWYAQRFRAAGALIPQSDPLLVNDAALKALGHGATQVSGPIHARAVARLATYKWQAGERDFKRDPLYLRAPDAKLPSGGSIQLEPSLNA